MTAREVADALRLDYETVRRWVAEGRIPAVPMPGRAIRIRREVVEEMLAAGSPGQPGSLGGVA